ncbi:MAG: molybdopterin converting factor subunit 1 [Rhodospirillaceae bacterium]|nr:molybdopterin converting factor subunit 1 [Rhodospirillaceae bacterium]MBT6304879.1 molybdopterin converting factor subunit 1 [Rhodospirillaceae bacterium]MBT7730211.1 molybdopterin converting factor subunit 1 [Rhodospirillaceae bacterium]MDC1442091.1 molybdopterin converting factor subunit 1 [Rhodospirillaceae bacterium]|tara:strand:+ start:201 stop:452 length:252 start_codon:yes stop_codon:yes gene_type:complete
MKLLYFAWIRVKMGTSNEIVDPPSTVENVQNLIDWIVRRNSVSSETFSDLTTIRVAVNQEYVGLDHPIKPGDEVAFFPPVTGG